MCPMNVFLRTGLKRKIKQRRGLGTRDGENTLQPLLDCHVSYSRRAVWNVPINLIYRKKVLESRKTEKNCLMRPRFDKPSG